MRFALIIAGGSGTRLWPMSRDALPKQLIPFIGGRSLLEWAMDRLAEVVPPGRRYVCAGQRHAGAVASALGDFDAEQFLGEPVGRDTVNAVGLGAAVLARRDPEAVIGVFPADHIIRPVERFREIISAGYAVAERHPDALVTFGITPTHPATGYGYLELGEIMEGPARRVRQFREKPDAETAGGFLRAGPECFLWNSGMFVWRATTLLDCLRRYLPETHAGLTRIADAWDTPGREAVLNEVYPNLRKISVDFAVMEPASRDPAVTVAAVPMPLEWLDVGSWPSFALTIAKDENNNAIAAERTLLAESRNTLVASNDPHHVIAAVGCDDLIIIHTADATLVCRRDRAEAIKDIQRQVAERYGPGYA